MRLAKTMMRHALVLVAFAAVPAVWADYKTMDYGPFVDATFQTSKANVLAYRGTAVGFDVPAGKSIMSAKGGYIFDMELLRPAAWWTGGFLNLDGVVFSGSHGANPTPAGNILLTTKPTPGWAKDGEWKDVRENAPYGPLPRDWGRFKGIYRADDHVVFAYTVGYAAVLEYPEQETIGGIKVLSRTLNIDSSAKPLTLVVADFAGAKGTAKGDQVEFSASLSLEVKELAPAEQGKKGKLKTRTEKVDGAVMARIQGIDGATLVLEETGRVVAHLPPLKAPAKAKISVWVGPTKDKETAAPEFAKVAGPLELAIYTKGGKARWTESFITKGALDQSEIVTKKGGKSTQPQQAYVVDSITPPFKNDYDSWMRIGGFDFFPDGRAAVCTWSGDVWVVSGIDDTLQKITWKRFAAGIHQALGLKIVNNTIHTLSRDGVTRLHDFNGDGEADFYESFNNDCLVTANFHEFVFDLHTDPQGNFYFIKAGPVRGGGRGWDTIVPHSGSVFKLSKDGQKLDVLARGFRAPNGMGLGPNGEITSGDNEGTWTPACPINWIKPGGFYGVADFIKGEKPKVRDNPLCWLPRSVDNSNGGQVWITGDKFGPLSGQLLHTSYGQSTMYLVVKEEAGGQMQGGVLPFLKFDSGVCRARFVPEKNALFLTGLRGWQTNAQKDAGFYRVRYTGKPLNLPIDLHVKKGELSIKFSDPLDPSLAKDTESYRLEQWQYRWTSDYGSPEFKISNPKAQGHDEVEIDDATVSADGKTVTLKVAALRPVMQMKITLNLKAADGTPIRTAIHNTINVVGNQRGEVHVGEYRVVSR
jgi:glucose/arabinose dehydrogenase